MQRKLSIEGQKHYHDTQAVEGVEHLGYRVAKGLVVARLVVVDTCSVADNLLNTAVCSHLAQRRDQAYRGHNIYSLAPLKLGRSIRSMQPLCKSKSIDGKGQSSR